MEIIEIALVFAFVVWVVGYLWAGIIEPIYMHFFKKPVYIHWSIFKKRITLEQLNVLERESQFYNQLSLKKKEYFEHRVHYFITNYEFEGREGFHITDDVKVSLAATYVMLTFGMRNYKINVFTKIIIYPSVYFSTRNEEYHKGEFNPKMKVIVFSWEDFIQGNKDKEDNLNLGLHEFAHALHFHCVKYKDSSAIIFAQGYQEIKKYVNNPENQKLLLEKKYFRAYAFVNPVEFIAVILEYFFETPEDFKSNFPLLYRKVSIMINHKS